MRNDLAVTSAPHSFKIMTEIDSCERCKLPMMGYHLSLRVEMTEGNPRSDDLVICEACQDSFRRWLSRRGRETPTTGERLNGENGRAGRPRSSRGSRFIDELDREESNIRAKIVLIASAIAPGVVAFLALAIASLVIE